MYIPYTMTRRPLVPTLFPYTTLFRSPEALHIRWTTPLQRGDLRRHRDWPQGVSRRAGRREQEASGFKAVAHHVVEHADRKSTRLNSSHLVISYAVFCLKKKNPHH